MELTVREYIDQAGRSSFARWFDSLNAVAAARVTTALARIELGNFSNVKGVGGGVFEYRIDAGPGYRVYFGKDGETVVHPGRRRNQEGSGRGYRAGTRALGGLQAAEE